MNETSLFALMVFVVVMLMSQAFVAPLMGSRRAAKKLLRQRIRNIGESMDGETHRERIRKKQLQKMTRFEQWLENMPMMDQLAKLIAQAGMEQPAHQTVFKSIGLALLTSVLVFWYTANPLLTLLIAALFSYLPFFILMRRRQHRLQLFEEQLPDALSIAARSLKAGLPFSEAINMVAKEMSEPISREFEQVFAELNYGGDLRSALLGMLERMPTIAVMAVATAVLIQRETGGNLAEVLDRISKLIRERFRFQRSVRTLTAEGRGTAWVVSIMPFAVAGLTEMFKPGWVTDLAKDPTGQQLILGAFLLMVIGIVWLRRLVSIDV